METMKYHEPVLLHESVKELITNKSGTYVDCTFGGGGHSKEVLKHLNADGRLIAFDQDSDALANRIEDDRFTLIMQNFRHLKNQLRFMQIQKVDGVLADLGVSSHQFDTADRGFSTRFDGALDMRMNQGLNKTAAHVVNDYSEEKLTDLFKNYGELRSPKKWARIVVTERKEQPIKTTEQLKSIFNKYVPERNRNKFYAQMFQALRIEVNDELKALEEMLMQSADVIRPEGRLVVISYHSLEDRLVKRFIKNGMFEGEPERDMYGRWYAPFRPLQSKVIVASKKEIEDNPRARSAKMRVGIRNEENGNQE